MATYNRENQSDRNRSFGKSKFRSDRPDMHKATCANCGKICEVPFRPTGSKPVFCRDCFRNNETSESSRSEKRSFEKPHQEDRQMYNAVCSNCGNTCQIPFRPSQGRDVFCSRCFEIKDSSQSRKPERRLFDKPTAKADDTKRITADMPNYKAQFEALNAKMDKILAILTPMPRPIAPLESVIDKHVIKEIVEEVKLNETPIGESQQKKMEISNKKPITKTKKIPSSKK